MEPSLSLSTLLLPFSVCLKKEQQRSPGSSAPAAATREQRKNSVLFSDKWPKGIDKLVRVCYYESRLNREVRQ